MEKIKWGKFLISSEFLTFALPAVSHGISRTDCDTQWCHAPGRPLPLSWHPIMFGMDLALFMDVGTSVMWQLIPFTSHPSNVVSTRYSVTALFPRQVTGNSHSFGLLLSIELDWAFWRYCLLLSLILFVTLICAADEWNRLKAGLRLQEFFCRLNPIHPSWQPEEKSGLQP